VQYLSPHGGVLIQEALAALDCRKPRRKGEAAPSPPPPLLLLGEARQQVVPQSYPLGLPLRMDLSQSSLQVCEGVDTLAHSSSYSSKLSKVFIITA
jgi:hypothetical protein